jgi:hypothetical protein
MLLFYIQFIKVLIDFNFYAQFFQYGDMGNKLVEISSLASKKCVVLAHNCHILLDKGAIFARDGTKFSENEILAPFLGDFSY